MKKILFAEDNDQLRNFLTLSLENKGYQIDSFADGLSAWNALKASQNTYDLLLTDLVMPGLGGLDLAQNALQLNPKLKTFFITGFSAIALTVNEEIGKNAHILSKPFHLNQLISEIETLLSQ